MSIPRSGQDGGAGRRRDSLVGTVLADRYQIIRRIGAGGMGNVYVARHMFIGRLAAIKVLHPEFIDDSAAVERFSNEGRAAGTLGHPNIVQCTDMGVAGDGAPFLVLELLEGVDIAAELDRIRYFPISRAISIALQVADGLGVAHVNGIIHRDLKAENVFLVDTRDRSDCAKILDFGISKFVRSQSRLTQKGFAIGTPDYMPPEQLERPDLVDQRCDIYALGVLLYQMLTGRLPFEDIPFPAVLTKITTEPPPSILKLAPDLPPGLAAVVHRAMEKSPANRYQSMREFATALLPFGAASTLRSAAAVEEPALPPRGPVIARRPSQPQLYAAPPEETPPPPRETKSEEPRPAPRSTPMAAPPSEPTQPMLRALTLGSSGEALSRRLRNLLVGATAVLGLAVVVLALALALALAGRTTPPLSATLGAPLDVGRARVEITSPNPDAQVLIRGLAHLLPFTGEMTTATEREYVAVSAPGYVTQGSWIVIDRSLQLDVPLRRPLDPAAELSELEPQRRARPQYARGELLPGRRSPLVRTPVLRRLQFDDREPSERMPNPLMARSSGQR